MLLLELPVISITYIKAKLLIVRFISIDSFIVNIYCLLCVCNTIWNVHFHSFNGIKSGCKALTMSSLSDFKNFPEYNNKISKAAFTVTLMNNVHCIFSVTKINMFDAIWNNVYIVNMYSLLENNWVAPVISL